MPTALDTALPPVAAKLIQQFGKAVSIETPGASTYDPVTGTSSPATTSVAAKAIVEDYPARDSLGGETAGNGVRRGDKKVTLAAQPLASVPTTSDRVVINGRSLSVVKVDAVYSGELAALYVLQCQL